jgi:repressor LexA
MKPITKKQAAALDFITNYLNTHPYAPSLKEIADGLGVKSASTAKALTDQLASKGFIAYEPEIHRSIRVTK